MNLWLYKKKLYNRDPHCRWCGRRVWLGEWCDPDIRATIEHLTPRHAGGKSNAANLGLACGECNRTRGSSLGPPPPR